MDVSASLSSQNSLNFTTLYSIMNRTVLPKDFLCVREYYVFIFCFLGATKTMPQCIGTVPTYALHTTLLPWQMNRIFIILIFSFRFLA
jgi:hypothetical protein